MSTWVRGSILPTLSAVGPMVVCVLAIASSTAAQTVKGRLVDTDTRKPVSAAEVSLLSGTSSETVLKRGLTTDSGTFSLTANSSGRYRLRAERIGYRAVLSSPFDLVASAALEVELRISSQAIPLEPLTVISHRPPVLGSIRLVSNGFFDRQEKWGAGGLHLGTFIDKETIERRQPIKVTQLLLDVPGVLVENAQVDGRQVQVVRMPASMNIVRGFCAPMLYLDGHPIRLVRWVYKNGEEEKLVQHAIIDDLVPPSSIAGIEVYSSISKPGEFTDMGVDPCGAIVIWTGFAGSRSDDTRMASGDSSRPVEPPRENEHTRTAQRLLEQADGTADSSAAGSLYRQALEAAQAAIAADSTNPLPHLQAGEAAIGVADYEKADRQFGVAEDLWPLYQLQTQRIREKAWVTLQQEGVPLVRAGRYEEAIRIFETANRFYRERPEVMLALGQLYGQEGNDDRALANLDSAALIIRDSSKLASVDSGTAADWKDRLDALDVTRAQVLAHAGRHDEAIAEYQKLLRTYPDDVGYKQELARLLIWTEQNDAAKGLYAELLRDSTLTAADLYQVGVGSYQMADYENAVKGFSGAASKRPRDRDALELWTRCLAMDSAYAALLPVAERWIALDPNNETAYMLAARAANRQGDPRKAGELVRRIESLQFTADHLSLGRGPSGAATLTGTVTNKTLSEGTRVKMTFTFYDDSGNAVGTQMATVTLGAQGQTVDLSVEFRSEASVGGYGYTVTDSSDPTSD